MSLPDSLLTDPDDREWCNIHDEPKPCYWCRQQAKVEAAEERYKEQ
jgi:hypothetical protein